MTTLEKIKAKIKPVEIQAHNGSQSLHDRAEFVFDRLKEIASQAASDFIEAGLLLNEAEELALWSHLDDPDTGEPFHNMGEFSEAAVKYGRSTYMEAKRVVREFAHIPMEDLKEIQRVNFKTLRLLPESQQLQPEWIQAAKGPEKDFVAKVQDQLPDLHVEKKQRLTFGFYESSMRVVDMALDRKLSELKLEDSTATKDDALELICAEWMEANGYHAE